ncbi:MAG TPA: DUF72 domain-containing protein [Actinomycetota bacterium]|jgi:uncharacterized protein YecE (DUF72 family)|nr:DUF72 domain-containing protein [Actinomycetota bacterium]
MIFVGTSGWQYGDWSGRFYPRNLPRSRWLEYFSNRYPTVEINNTFYRLPGHEAFVRWREESAEDFVITIKASRYITHIRRLRDCRDPLRLLWSRCRRLGDKLGPVLFQLPPRFPVDAERLRRFCRVLPSGMRAAFEFRDRSWETDEVFQILDDAGAAFVWADSPGARIPSIVTGSWAYVRFHAGSKLRPGYSRAKLRRWADRVAGVDAADVFAYFNNDAGGAALRDAQTLGRYLRARTAGVRAA